MTMITPSYLGETIEYSSLHACRSTLEDPTAQPDPDWGEIAVAFISLTEDSALGPEAIRTTVKPRLGIRTPKRIEIVHSLPKNTNGKVDKNLLRERLATKGDAA